MKLSNQIAPSFIHTFKSHKTHQIYKGGRGSTKTSMISLKIVYNCLKEDNCSVVILRKHQNQLRKSVYKEIKRACTRMGLVENIHYVSTVSPMEIKFLQNGNTIYFAGGDDFETVKGTIDENKLIKIVWFEELTGWDNSEDIDQIVATFTRGNNDWFMALYSYNPPRNKFAWINKWCDSMKLRDNYLVSETDYRTVPEEWLGKMFINEAERMKKFDGQCVYMATDENGVAHYELGVFLYQHGINNDGFENSLLPHNVEMWITSNDVDVRLDGYGNGIRIYDAKRDVEIKRDEKN